MKAKKLFPKLAAKTHMPFVSGDVIVFCQSSRLLRRTQKGRFWDREGKPVENPEIKYRPWDLAYVEVKRPKIRTIETGLPEDSILCSPAFFQKDGRVQFSFIGGVPEGDRLHFHLYSMSGPSFDQLSRAEKVGDRKTKVGFISPSHFCHGQGRSLVLLDRASKRQIRLTPTLERILRATFDPEAPHRILMTGINDWADRVTLLYDLKTERTEELRAEGSVYKSCLSGSEVIFANRESQDEEDYELRKAPVSLDPTLETVKVEQL